MQKFNEALVQQVREGKLWLQCEGDLKKTKEVLKYIFPKDSAYTVLEDKFYIGHHKGAEYWLYADFIPDGYPSAKVSEFFLPAQPLRIEDVTDKQVIHCKSRSESDAILNLLDTTGCCWAMGGSLSSEEHWTTYGENTFYRVVNNGIFFGSIQSDHCRNQGYEILPASLFLQPPTEKEGKERTYRVTRQRLKDLYEASDLAWQKEIRMIVSDNPWWENNIYFPENKLAELFTSKHQPIVDLAIELFPDFNPAPHIPKGEFAWVRDEDHKEWVCRMSAGNGRFYTGQNETLLTMDWDHVRKYEDRPF